MSVSPEDSGQLSQQHRAAEDAAVEPWALLQAVRDPAGRIIDFTYRDINPVAARQQRLRPEDLIGRSVAKTLPEVARIGLIEQYAHVVETGEPLIVDDLAHHGRTLDGPELQTHRFELRGVRVGTEFLSLNWRDVNHRYLAHKQVSDAEERLRLPVEKTEMYRQSMHSAAIGMCLADLEGTLFEVNDALCEFFGYDAETLRTLTWQELTDPEYLQADLDKRAAAMAGEIDSYRMTKRFIHADGHRIWGDLSVSCVRDSDGQAVTFIGQIIDITDEVEARAELERTRALLAASADSMLDPQVLFEAVRDPAGKVCDFRYVSVNRAALNYLGVTERELLGRGALDTLPNLEGSGLLARYALCLADGEPVVLNDFSYFNEMIEDDRRYDIRATRAGPELLTLSWADVTERFQSAQRLADSEEQYRLLAENASDLIVHVRDGRFVWVSPSVTRVLGADAQYWIGREVAEGVPVEDRAAFAERLAILDAGGSVQQRVRARSLDGVIHWVHLHSRPFYDADGRRDGYIGSLRVIDGEVVAEQEAQETRRRLEDARIRQAESKALERGVIDKSIIATAMSDVEGRFVLVNDAMCDLVGYDADALRQMTWQDITAPEFLDADLQILPDLLTGKLDVYRVQKQYLHRDGRRVWGDMAASAIRTPEGKPQYLIAQILDITSEMESRQQLEQARRVQARADALYRRSMDSAAVGMCLTLPDGTFLDVNDALCEFLGYDAQTLMTKTWIELTPEDYRAVDLGNVADLMAGRIESYRTIKQYIHSNGHLVWGELSVGCVRDDDGRAEVLIAQVVDITEEVQYREQLRTREQQNRLLAQSLQSELDSAEHYLRSVLPGDMTGQVSVSSRYLPSQSVGGDFFDFFWLDDDHLIIYLLDVSGHGVQAALVAVAVHNLVRSASLPRETLLEPDRVLAVLNQHFAMERHNDNYFTAWYGVYQPSTGSLRYAGAGHPPALVLADGQSTELVSNSRPVGMFDDTEFAVTTHRVAPGSQLLIYSDGAYELPHAENGRWSFADFVSLVTGLAGAPDWSLDELVEKLRRRSATKTFTDDCCLVKVEFEPWPRRTSQG